MALVKYNKLASFLDSGNKIPGLFLIYGDPYLVKQAFNFLSSFLLGNDKKEFALEILEGGSVTMGDLIEQVATFSFLFSKKIVAVKNAPLFQTSPGNVDICFSPSDLDHLITFIENGIPSNHFLVMMTTEMDKRKKIYKAIEDKGVVIDCAVAQGMRKADTDEQMAVLQTVADHILSKAQKTIESRAFHTLSEMTGFNLDLLARNLEKLISYSGKNREISLADISAVVKRDKKDPIFNLTNAFIDKDVKNTLFYLTSLFNEGYHPLQILKSFENLIRKLILVKSFTKAYYRQTQNISLKKINFNSFKQTVLPQIIDYDKQIKKDMEEQEAYLSKQDEKKKTVKANDLFLAPNPQNPYPVFQVFQKSENFSLKELQQSIFFLSDLDYRLKSSSFDAKTAIESFIIKTCSKGGFVYADKNQDRRHHF